jgi:hypothetical protein
LFTPSPWPPSWTASDYGLSVELTKHRGNGPDDSISRSESLPNGDSIVMGQSNFLRNHSESPMTRSQIRAIIWISQKLKRSMSTWEMTSDRAWFPVFLSITCEKKWCSW